MVRHDVLGAELTTLHIGGPIRTVVDVNSEDELVRALEDYPDAICIGGGSNLIISDDGFEGTIIRVFAPDASGIAVADSLVRVEAPVEWDGLVQATIDAGLQGLEATSGVPGSVGGGIVQNLGAYGQEVADVVVSVDVFDRQTQQRQSLSREECEFRYRESRFKHDTHRRFIVTSAQLEMYKTDSAHVRYGDVSELLAQRLEHEGPYPLGDIRQAVLDVRSGKGMVLGASLPSAGSFFTNPIVTDKQASELETDGLRVIHRPDGVKLVSAAALLEAAGYQKGHRHGNVGLSELHLLALVNCGGATTSEVINLAVELRNAVHQRFGVWLKPEPVMLGFESNPFRHS